MPTSLDIRPEATPSIPGIEELDTNPLVARRQAAKQAFQSNQQTQQAAQQATIRATDEDNRKKAARTFAGEAIHWAKDPTTTGKSFGEIDPYSQDEMVKRYPDIAGEIPGLYDQIQSDVTGRVVGPRLTTGESATGKVGNTTVQTGKMAEAEPQFDDFTTPQDVQAAMPEGEASLAEQIGTYKVGINALGKFPANKKMQILRAAKVFNPDFDVKEFNNLNRARS